MRQVWQAQDGTTFEGDDAKERCAQHEAVEMLRVHISRAVENVDDAVVDALVESIEANPESWLAVIMSLMPNRPSSKRSGSRQRPLSHGWKSVLAATVKDGIARVTTLDEFQKIGDNMNMPIDRANLRSHLWAYTKRGFVLRVRDGLYVLTKQGALEVGVSLRDDTSQDASK